MVMTKTGMLDKAQATSLMNDFFKMFQDCINHPEPINPKTFAKFLAPDFKISSNDHIIAKSLTEYMPRVELLKKKYSHFEISEINAEPLISGNKMVVKYRLNLTSRNGPKVKVNIMAIATVDEHKISIWDEVTNEEGTSRWDHK